MLSKSVYCSEPFDHWIIDDFLDQDVAESMTNEFIDFDDGKARTLEEVGNLFDVTRERIRQIESKALRKLRHPNRIKKLKEFGLAN